MILDHEFYEIQSALAATGQLTDAELTELEQHADACAACREYLTDMACMSRELFLARAANMGSKSLPDQMEDRFLERAARAGIPVRRAPSTRVHPPFLGVAAIAAFLAICVSLDWKQTSLPNPEQVEASASPGSQPVPALRVFSQGAPPTVFNATYKRKFLGQHRASANSSARNISADRRDSSQKSPTSFLGCGLSGSDRLPFNLLATGRYTPSPAFSKDAPVADFLGRDQTSNPAEPAFHLDLKLASLSLLDLPQNKYLESDPGRLEFSAPVFHLKP